MFTSLHALAQAATLLVVVTTEGDDQLRINVTPTRTDDKTKPHKLRPLSLVGTPAELDEGFAAALAEWQAPRRSLIEQARDTGDDDVKATAASSKAAKPALPAPEKKTEAAPAPGRKKPGPKPKSSSADATPAGAAGGDVAAGGDAALADDSGTAASSAVADDPAGAEPAADPDTAAAAPAEITASTASTEAEPAADEFTLDLF